MGQRLNIEIVDRNGEGIANAYYHWSGYTSSSLELLKQVVSYYEDNKEKFVKNGKLDKTLIAVRMLEATGAGTCNFPEDRNTKEGKESKDKEILKEKYPNETFRDGIDRNEGLISVSEEGMDQTRSWEEARIDVNIDTEHISFGVYYDADEEELAYEVDPEEEMDEDELDAAIQDYILKIDEIGKDLTYDIGNVPFEKVEEFAKVISNAPYTFKYKGYLYSKIE